MDFKEWLINQTACSGAVEWVGERTLEQAWDECERGDWMLWLAQKVGVDLKMLTLAKVRCVRLAEHLMTERRSLNALDVGERFARGEATRDELDAAAISARAARAAARAAVDAAVDAIDAAADCDAAGAAVIAADAAVIAADAAVIAADAAADCDAADAAVIAADAVAASYGDYFARVETLKKCADIVRETLNVNLIKERIENGV